MSGSSNSNSSRSRTSASVLVSRVLLLFCEFGAEFVGDGEGGVPDNLLSLSYCDASCSNSASSKPSLSKRDGLIGSWHILCCGFCSLTLIERTLSADEEEAEPDSSEVVDSDTSVPKIAFRRSEILASLMRSSGCFFGNNNGVSSFE